MYVVYSTYIHMYISKIRLDEARDFIFILFNYM